MVAYLDTNAVTVDREPTLRHRRNAAFSSLPRLTRAEQKAEQDDAGALATALYAMATRAAGNVIAEALEREAGLIGARARRAGEIDGAACMAQRADRWLVRRFGRCDDDLRRALTASLASTLVPQGLPAALTSLYPAAHFRLARYLTSGAPYDADCFGKDLAFGSGAFAPAGAMSVGVLSSETSAARLLWAKKAVGLWGRTARARRWSETIELACVAGVRPWAELHLDTRHLREFHGEGMQAMYHRLAALLRLRPDLAGVHGASWLYDPVLGGISPGLDFMAEPIRTGGAILVRLGVDPVQTAYAVARSPTRRKLWLEGRYQPTCYGMYWPRERLLAWCETRR